MPNTDKDLFRALKISDFPGEFQVDDKPLRGLLYPRFEVSSYTDGKGNLQTSQADVVLKPNAGTHEQEVQTGGGTSLFNVGGWFGYINWKDFKIPAQTEYPEGLVIKTGKKKKNRDKVEGIHYQIEPKNPMTVDAFKGALDTFARNALLASINKALAGQ